MPHQLLLPAALLEQTNLSGSVSEIRRNPRAEPTGWLAAPGNNNTVGRIQFPTPERPLTPGPGLQEFAVRVRKTNHSTDPTCTVELYESGVLVSTLITAQAISSTVGTLLTATWDANGRNLAAIECRVSGTVGGGNPSNRASLEIGPIAWFATINSEHVYKRRVAL